MDPDSGAPPPQMDQSWVVLLSLTLDLIIDMYSVLCCYGHAV